MVNDISLNKFLEYFNLLRYRISSIWDFLRMGACWERLKNELLPPRCICCGEYVEKVGLCNYCWKEIRWISEPKCNTCGQPIDDGICKYCVVGGNFFDRVVSVMQYEGLARHLILKFKDGDATLYAPIFAKWLNRIIQDFFCEIDFLVPIPITYKRRFKRKYNQTELLCMELQKLTGLSYRPEILRKIRETMQQKSLNKEKRLINLRKSFSVNAEISVKDKVVLLVDDVITTGATANACAELLKKSGAAKVYVATVARVILKSTVSNPKII